jgi:hypothetical protein
MHMSIPCQSNMGILIRDKHKHNPCKDLGDYPRVMKIEGREYGDYYNSDRR